jgi:hypothetical protein
MSNTGGVRQPRQFLVTTNRDVLLPSRTTKPSPATTGSALLDPQTNPNAWMVLLVENKPTPGWIVDIEGFDLETGWDVKTGKGAKGGSLTLTNQPPSKGSITWAVGGPFLPLLMSQWAEFLPKFKYQPDKNQSTNAISVYHPSLADVGVTSVVVKSISPWRHMGRGKYERKIAFIVWTPPPVSSIVSTPSRARETSAPSVKGAPPDPISDEIQRRIARHLKEAQLP